MDTAGKSPKALTLIAAILLLCFLISTAVVLALNLRFVYYHDIKALGIAESSGMSPETIRRNYDVLIDYNLLWHKEALRMPDFPMSAEGEIHFREVKGILDAFQILFLLSIAGLALIWLWCREKIGRSFARLAGWICFGLTALLGLFALIGWDKLFVGFHKLFFNNDFWIFDASTDPVITILPDTFFLHEALLILGVVLLGGGIAFIWGRKRNG